VGEQQAVKMPPHWAAVWLPRYPRQRIVVHTVQGVLPNVYRVKELKKEAKVQQKDCRDIDRQIDR
jgi:hypothetical protein